MISSFITGQLSSKSRRGRNLQMLWDFYAGCQWSIRPIKMTPLFTTKICITKKLRNSFDGDKK
jgi:hypothetical protein